VPILRRATLVCRVCCSTAREALMPHLEKGKVLILRDGNTTAEQRVSISQFQLALHSDRWLDREVAKTCMNMSNMNKNNMI